MKKLIVFLLALTCVFALFGCSKSKQESKTATPTESIHVPEATDTESQNEVLKFLTEKYGLMVTLWGPEGSDLYVFYIYPDHAERECNIMMPENTDDVSESHKNLSWEVVNDELVITGEWQETFKIDISAETATSTTTGKEYKLYEMQP